MNSGKELKYVRNSKAKEEAKRKLDRIFSEFNHAMYVQTDPISLVHSFDKKEDQEVVALIAALFSFGNVTSILKTLESVLRPLGDRPYETLMASSPAQLRVHWKYSYYRFYTSSDITNLFLSLKKILEEHGDLGSAFKSCWTGNTLDSLARFRALFRPAKTNGHRFMFADPHAGAAKRWHMFLRWLVRKDAIDLGLWDFVPKSSLILPLDTHLFDISRALKLTSRKTAGLQTALELTELFRKWNPEDPIKYDFALCRIGVLGLKTKLHEF